ncbi:hypothetical protein [Alienimonas californiensis]|uniref:Uncharacterized protein n=1 Tax=Alienimonas californiensis TaxID=2527989 RepID=A0A517P9H2_9PLAN|nr:hypothetical protein [Alienimonas californiensis]QDT16021.1 hypothetical protein CA12_21190 [Alienimonas californiensis]
MNEPSDESPPDAPRRWAALAGGVLGALAAPATVVGLSFAGHGSWALAGVFLWVIATAPFVCIVGAVCGAALAHPDRIPRQLFSRGWATFGGALVAAAGISGVVGALTWYLML